MSGPNPEQQAAIEALDGDASISAGAGTGKTFTLTARIVHAIEGLCDSNDIEPLPIYRVMAITFTKAAASELRSRVRSAIADAALRCEDIQKAEVLHRCALEVDNAWISTIHSMAGRILRENALAFGIDPAFEVLSEKESAAFEMQALENVLSEAASNDDPAIQELIADYETYSDTSRSMTILDLIGVIRSRRKVMRDDSQVIAGSCKLSDKGLIELYDIAKQVLDVSSLDGWSKGDANKLPEIVESIRQAIELTEAYLLDVSDLSEEARRERYVEALYSYPPTTDKFGHASKPFYDLLNRYRSAYRKAATQVYATVSARKIQAIEVLAEQLDAEVDRLKRHGGMLLDNDDLLRMCNQKLAETSNEQILNRYKNQFLYVMIDEFQDTDRLQMEMISLISDTGSDPRGGLCTVGDRQQSIYRFRGAEVSVSMCRDQIMEEGGGKLLSLTENYRSHSKILEAVERVFSLEESFGDDFLHLSASREQEEVTYPIPRVTFSYIHSQNASPKQGKESLSDLRKPAVAYKIAAHFKKLVDFGVSPSKMALLLGNMNNAQLYSDALRSFGIESVITGGSVFAETDEASIIYSLLSFAVDPFDDQAVFKCLISPLFNITDNALLSLARTSRDAKIVNTPLGKAFFALDGDTDDKDMNVTDKDSLLEAKRHLFIFAKQARTSSISFSLRHLLLRSGYLERLQRKADATSLACAGNLSKALNIVSQLEAELTGISSVCDAFKSYLQFEKATPGSLSTEQVDHVSIMTVHASKGLEFDHVVVSDLKDGESSRSNIIAENIGDNTYAAISLSKSDFPSSSAYDAHSKVMGFFAGRLEECESSLAEYVHVKRKEAIGAIALKIENSGDFDPELLCRYTQIQESLEAKRLLYVAMTRARETLLVIHDKASAPKADSYKGIYKDVFEAVCEIFGAVEDDMSDLAFIQDDIAFTRIYISDDNLEEILAHRKLLEIEPGGGRAGDGIDDIFSTYDYPTAPKFVSLPYAFAGSHLCSYTYLSQFNEHEETLDDNAPLYKNSAAELPSENALSLGTAFHRVAQAMIEANKTLPPEMRKLQVMHDRTHMQIKKCNLTESQSIRLKASLELWANSRVCKAFFAHENIAAEVPFTIQIKPVFSDSLALSAKSLNRTFTLEGEIDALAYDGDKVAYLIDYKTGISDSINEEVLYEKHLFQAQCYALALFENGFDEVRASFVRIEDRSTTSEYEPYTVEYLFDKSDMQDILNKVNTSWAYAIQK